MNIASAVLLATQEFPPGNLRNAIILALRTGRLVRTIFGVYKVPGDA